MSNIQTFLENILSARYGKDVRQSIHDAIVEIDGVADTAQTSATAQAEAARKSAQTSELKAEAAATSEANAKTYMEAAGTSEANAKVSETNAKASENSAKESENSAKLTEERAREVFESIPEDYSTISNDLYELAIKETASGEEIHVNDSSNLKLREFALYGKAKQNTTSGKNLIPISEYTTNASGNTHKEMVAPVLEIGETYILSGKTTDGKTVNIYNCQILWKKSKESVDAILVSNNTMWSSGQLVDVDTSETGYFHIYTTSELAGKTIQIQLEKGTVATPYEKFTGCQPSPSPDFPQEIEVPSGDVVVKSCGKNLLPNNATNITIDNVTFTINDIDKSIRVSGTNSTTNHESTMEVGRFIANFSGIVKLSGVSTSNSNDRNPHLYVYNETLKQRPYKDETKTELQTSNQDSTVKELEFYIEKGETYRVNCRVNAGQSANTIVYPMVSREGGEYQPYKETLATIPTENGLAGINDVRDVIVKYADGKGERINNIEKCKLADLSWTYTGNEGERRFVSSDLVGVIKEQKDSNSLPIALCDSYRVLSYADCYGKYTDKTMTVIFESSGLHGQLWIINTDFDNVEDFKNSLGDSLFYYQLKEPIITPLTAEEIAEIEKLSTFYPVTNISNDADCGMKVTYYCDSKNYIDKKISELATAMVNNI